MAIYCDDENSLSLSCKHGKILKVHVMTMMKTLTLTAIDAIGSHAKKLPELELSFPQNLGYEITTSR